jgi:hypothetical protein
MKTITNRNQSAVSRQQTTDNRQQTTDNRQQTLKFSKSNKSTIVLIHAAFLRFKHRLQISSAKKYNFRFYYPNNLEFIVTNTHEEKVRNRNFNIQSFLILLGLLTCFVPIQSSACSGGNYVTAQTFCLSQTVPVTLEFDQTCSDATLAAGLGNVSFQWQFEFTANSGVWQDFTPLVPGTNYTILPGQDNFLTENFNSALFNVSAGFIHFRVLIYGVLPSSFLTIITNSPVAIINTTPSGSFTAPFTFCSGTNPDIFFFTNDPLNTFDYNNSTIDLDDFNGPQPLTLPLMQALNNPNLGLVAPWNTTGTYTVSLHLVNACGFLDIQQTYTILDQITFSSQDVAICEGTIGTVNLLVNSPSGIVFDWFEQPSNTFIGTGNPLPINAPTSTTSYYAEPQPAWQYPCASPIPIVQNVVIIAPQTIELDGPIELCGKNPFYYEVQNPISGVVYEWTITGGNPSSYSGNSLPVFWNDLSVGGTITVSAPGFPCLLPAEITTKPCCNPNTEFSLYLTGTNFASNIIQAGGIFNQSWMNNQGPYTNFIVDGIFIVDIPITFSGVTVEFMEGASMRIEPGVTVALENATVFKAACDKMWEGIVITDPTSSLLINGQSILQDAIIGVYANSCSVVNLFEAELNKNLYHIIYENCSASNGLRVLKSSFACEPTNTSPGIGLLAPYLGESSYCGIYAIVNDLIEIGNGTNQSDNNRFKGMAYGIVSHYSNINVYNNTFLEINQSVPVVSPLHYQPLRNACKSGTAICISGNTIDPQILGALTYEAKIGDLFANAGSQYWGNDIDDANVGIRTLSNVSVSILNNDINNINQSAIYLGNKDYTRVTHYLEKNRMNNAMDYYIQIQNAPFNVVDVRENEINNQFTNPAASGAIGIYIAESSQSTYPVNIEDNVIKFVRTGIQLINKRRVLIYHNEIFPEAQSAYVYGAGIKVSDCTGSHIQDNSVYAVNRNNIWVDGIRISNSVFDEVHCNYLYKTGSGLFFEGNCGPTKVYANNMRRNFWGLVLNYGQIGNQLVENGVDYAADNIWTGDYSTPDPGHNGNYWHTNAWASIPMLSILRTRNQPGTPYLPNPFFATTDVANPTFSNFLAPDFINPQWGNVLFVDVNQNDFPNFPYTCNNPNATDLSFGPDELEDHFTGGSNAGNGDDEAKAWWLNYTFLKEYRNNPVGLSTPLQALYDSLLLAPMGQLLDIQIAIADSFGVDEAYLLNLSSSMVGISTTLQQEISWKEALELVLNQEINQLDTAYTTPSLAEISAIENLAALCPLTHGPGVYLCRALYTSITGLVDGFVNDCEKIGVGSGARLANSLPYAEYIAPGEEEDLNWEKASTSNYANRMHFSVYPNPASSTISFQLPENTVLRLAEIYDARGKLVSQISSSTERTLDVSQLSNGLYFLKLQCTNGKTYTEKITIQQ